MGFLNKCGKFFSWFYLIGVGIIIPLSILAWAIFDLVTRKNVTSGTVTNNKNCTKNSDNTYTCNGLTVSYTVNGTVYDNIRPTNYQHLDQAYSDGDIVSVNYKPSDPSTCNIHSMNKLTLGIILIVIAVFTSLFGIGVWYAVQHNETMAKIFCLTSLIKS